MMILKINFNYQIKLEHSPKKDMAEFNLACGSFLEIREKRSGSGSSKYTKLCLSLYNILYKIYGTYIDGQVENWTCGTLGYWYLLND
jgi:hypothetical protein